MKLTAYAPDPLNEQASVLVDAQTDIKTVIKQGVLSGAPFALLKEQIGKIIARALSRIRSPTLKEDARKSLMRFANAAYGRFKSELRQIPAVLLPVVVVLMRAITEKEKAAAYYVPKNAEERMAAEMLNYREYGKGIPLQEFQKTYIDRVSNALDGLAQERALDPNDFTGRNSLRNLAEMQVRYERHQSEITGFREKGTKLVVCSVHGDCSDRCAPWQGKVYSLDGTSGITEDGRRYQPLENATDIYYTTRAGRRYKNGLLGFNCRHTLSEYRSRMIIPTVSTEEQKQEYAITQTQRAMEREIIYCREKALIEKGVNVSEYRKWKNRAQERYEEYKKFSKDNGRAYYPDRVKIL
ncbi:MAG: hypothetical protein OSJ39_00630 [Clostridia bacterium]|nr:hypothetical protein [Clostridia bacterium]